MAFILVAGVPPFSDTSDTWYSLIRKENFTLFWSQHENYTRRTYSQEFKDIIQSLLACDPVMRPSMAELSAFPWVLGPTASDDEMWVEFERRLALINGRQEEEEKFTAAGRTRRQFKSVHNQEIVDEEASESELLKELRKEVRELRDEPETKLLLSDKVPLGMPDAYVALSLVIEACKHLEHTVKPGKFKVTFANKETGLCFTAEIFKQRGGDQLVVQLQRI